MRIGLNLLYLIPGVVGGTETYAKGLLAGFHHLDSGDEFVVFVNRQGGAWELPDNHHFKRIVCPVDAENRKARYFFEQVRLPRLLKMHAVDLVHSLGYVSPLAPPCPFVVTIPDLNYRAFGDQIPRIRRWALEVFVRVSAQRASRVLTISEFAKKQITNAFRLQADRVVVTHLAARPSTPAGMTVATAEAPPEELGICSPFALAFSSRSPNKNIPRLIEAFRLARQEGSIPGELVLVGHWPEGIARSADGAVRFVGYLKDESVAAVLARAEFLVFPSLYEGFGLPVLEAMAAGVPVACSNRASLPEVAGDAALYFDPESVEEMAAAIARMATDEALRESLIEKGRRNVERFSWEHTAALTLDVYRQALDESLEKRARR